MLTDVAGCPQELDPQQHGVTVLMEVVEPWSIEPESEHLAVPCTWQQA